jgi:glycosyltransferase involved in cell wall biosynthesis
MTITVIVPAHDAAASLGRCLAALAASTRAPDEVIVVDDRSTDGTTELARGLGARVALLPEALRGPAAARNHGANQARGELLVFVDADVAVHADALERIEGHLDQNPGVAALFGSYDDDPPEPGLASRYKNLLHHHTHQLSRREAATFWAGCGAIRTSVFLAAGGFDERYRHPAIEDIELGARLRAAGWCVWSTPDVQAAHLKRWTLWNVIATDIFRRALPWSRLIARTGMLPNDLNLSGSGRLSAVCAWMLLLALVVGIRQPKALLGALPAAGVLGLCNARLFGLFARRGGAFFAASAAGLHWLYYLYSSLTFALIAGPRFLWKCLTGTNWHSSTRAARRTVITQVVLVGSSWLWLCGLHWGNDGLWPYGDATRHMANGLFWKDYLQRLDPHPVEFALSYYARYPVINPVSYPPVFYVLEAVTFAVFGPSPYVAKGLVLAFALIAALVTTAWLRRWVAPEAGFLGAMVPLLPDAVRLSHAIMLNVPAFALVAAALYAARRWLDEPESRWIYPAALVSLLAILCYIPSAILVFVLVAWMVALGRARLLVRPRTLLVAVGCGLVLLPWALVIVRWAPGHAEMITPAMHTITRHSSRTFYLNRAGSVFGPVTCGLAVTGAIAGLASRRWRRETTVLLLWVGVTVLVLTYLKAKDPRYLLPLATPLVCLAALAIVVPARLVRGRLPQFAGQALVPAAMAALVLAAAARASAIPIPQVQGLQPLVAFLARAAPSERVFYDGGYSGIFTVLARAADPALCRQVIRGDKMLYIAPILKLIKPRSFAATPQEVLDTLRRRAGCRWLAIEEATAPGGPVAATLLRAVVAGPEFEHVRTFCVTAPGPVRIHVYRMRGPVETPEAIDLPVPMLGAEARLRVRPINW